MTTQEKIEQKKKKYQLETFYTKTYEELKTIEEKVIRLLHDNKHLRNCDKCLIHTYWKTFDELNTKTNDLHITIIKLTPAGSIIRSRSYIQNELGLYEPDEETKMKRGIREQAHVDYYTQ